MRASNQFAEATTGVVYVHASPAAVCPHVEWASFVDPVGAGEPRSGRPNPPCPDSCVPSPTGWARWVPARSWPTPCASWSVLRFEVTEDPSEGVDGHRWCHTPQLGLWSGAMSANGDVMVGEHAAARSLMASGADALAADLDSGAGHGMGRSPGALPRRWRHRRGHLAEPGRRLAHARRAATYCTLSCESRVVSGHWA